MAKFLDNDYIYGRINYSPNKFNFMALQSTPMSYMLSLDDINGIHRIITSLKYKSKPKRRNKEIDDILVKRGFRKYASGTNRVVYENESFGPVLLKIALDGNGIQANIAEYHNQMELQPYVSKMFEVSHNGAVAVVERVRPITNQEEFLEVAEDIFDLLEKCILGRFVLEDIGTKFFMNYGVRPGFGPVLLDYPYVYDVSGGHLYCTEVYQGVICDGGIEYDPGFNYLRCQKCGERIIAKNIPMLLKENKIKNSADIKMHVTLKKNGVVISENYQPEQTDYIER